MVNSKALSPRYTIEAASFAAPAAPPKPAERQKRGEPLIITPGKTVVPLPEEPGQPEEPFAPTRRVPEREKENN